MSNHHYSFAKRHISSFENYEINPSSSQRSRDKEDHEGNSQDKHSHIVHSDDDTSKQLNGRWTVEEHALFEQGLQKFGKNWEKIAKIIETRTAAQVRSHAQKYFFRVQKEKSKEVPKDLLQSGRPLRNRETSSLKSYDSSQNIMKTPPNKPKETNKYDPKSTFQKEIQERQSFKYSNQRQSSRFESTRKKKKYVNDQASTSKKQQISKTQKIQVQQSSKPANEPTLTINLVKLRQEVNLTIRLQEFFEQNKGQTQKSFFHEFVTPALIASRGRFERIVQGQITRQNYSFSEDKDEEDQDNDQRNNPRRRLNFKGLRISDHIDIIQEKVEEENDDSRMSSHENILGSRYSAFREWQRSNSSRN